MKKEKAHLTIAAALGGFFLFIDRILKYIARTYPDFSYYIFRDWIGWSFFKNPGIAFSISIPDFVVIFLTPFVLLFLFIYFLQKKTTKIERIALIFIISGATSNFIDRVLFQFTIDYIRLYTSIINIADLMIISGVTILIKENLFKK